MHPEQVGRTNESKRCQLTVGHSALASVPEIALDMGPVRRHQVPGTAHPFSAHLIAGVPGGDPVEPGVNAMGVERHCIFRADQGEGWLAVAKSDQGAMGAWGFEMRGRNPSAVGHDHGPASEPVAIVQDHVRISLPLDRNQVRADHCGPTLRTRPNSERPGDLAPQGRASQPEFVNRPSQCQRFQSGHGEVFNEAKTHDPSPAPEGSGAR